MSDVLLETAHDGDALAKIDEALHDAAFSISDLRFSEQEEAAELRLTLPGRNRDLALRLRKRRRQPTDYLLKIRGVTAVEVHDPEGLATHSYATLVATEDDRLVLSSNFPGRLTFTVTRVDVRLYSSRAGGD